MNQDKTHHESGHPLGPTETGHISVMNSFMHRTPVLPFYSRICSRQAHSGAPHLLPSCRGPTRICMCIGNECTAGRRHAFPGTNNDLIPHPSNTGREKTCTHSKRAMSITCMHPEPRRLHACPSSLQSFLRSAHPVRTSVLKCLVTAITSLPLSSSQVCSTWGGRGKVTLTSAVGSNIAGDTGQGCMTQRDTHQAIKLLVLAQSANIEEVELLRATTVTKPETVQMALWHRFYA